MNFRTDKFIAECLHGKNDSTFRLNSLSNALEKPGDIKIERSKEKNSGSIMALAPKLDVNQFYNCTNCPHYPPFQYSGITRNLKRCPSCNQPGESAITLVPFDQVKAPSKSGVWSCSCGRWNPASDLNCMLCFSPVDERSRIGDDGELGTGYTFLNWERTALRVAEAVSSLTLSLAQYKSRNYNTEYVPGACRDCCPESLMLLGHKPIARAKKKGTVRHMYRLDSMTAIKLKLVARALLGSNLNILGCKLQLSDENKEHMWYRVLEHLRSIHYEKKAHENLARAQGPIAKRQKVILDRNINRAIEQEKTSVSIANFLSTTNLNSRVTNLPQISVREQKILGMIGQQPALHFVDEDVEQKEVERIHLQIKQNEIQRKEQEISKKLSITNILKNVDLTSRVTNTPKISAREHLVLHRFIPGRLEQERRLMESTRMDISD